jgi:diaminopimelate epimerase
MDETSSAAPLRFRKMHGLGNDFVVIDARAGGARVPPALARALADRRRGVGFDQLVEILPDVARADARLAFLNADGSEAGACGNATRCVADLLMRETGRESVTLRTRRGLLRARRRPDGLAEVDMGRPQFEAADIPVAPGTDPERLPLPGAPAAVGMGNPHCVLFVEDAEAAPAERLGPELEHHPLFPERANIGFAQILGPDRIRLRVWERGAGLTLACGSGACAAVVAAARRGLTRRRVHVDLDGGALEVDWREDGVHLAGPAARVFEGVLDPAFVAAAEAQPA